MNLRLPKFLLVGVILLLGACATRQQAYQAPSSAPVRESVARAQGGVKTAQDRVVVLTKTKLDPQQTAMVNALSRDLFGVQRELVTAQAKITELDGKVHEQTDKLNTATAKADTLEKFQKSMSAHWGLGAIGFGVGLLLKHLLILAAVLLIIGIAIWIAKVGFAVALATVRAYLHI